MTTPRRHATSTLTREKRRKHVWETSRVPAMMLQHGRTRRQRRAKRKKSMKQEQGGDATANKRGPVQGSVPGLIPAAQSHILPESQQLPWRLCLRYRKGGRRGETHR